MNRFTMSNLAMLMNWKVSTKEIDKIMDRLEIQPSDNLHLVSDEAVHVAGVQLQIKRYASLADYIIDMNLYVSDAVNRRAQLICFPALAGLLPVSIVPQFDKCLESAQPDPATGRPDPEFIHEALTYFSDFAFDAWSGTMSALAARHRVCIMAGSTLYFENDELCHRAFLYNQNGEMIGFQDRASPVRLELELGVLPAAELKLFETPVGPVCILIDSDAHYFELARIAKNMGAQLLLCPAMFQEEYTSIVSAIGLNMRVQEQKLYGVQSTLVGDTGLGFPLEGGCCIFAPNELVKFKNGMFAKANGRFEPDIVTAQLNLDRLSAIRNPYTSDHNRDFMYNNIDRLY